MGNFRMMQKVETTLADIENMVPYEREIYMSIMLSELQKQANG